MVRQMYRSKSLQHKHEELSSDSRADTKLCMRTPVTPMLWGEERQEHHRDLETSSLVSGSVTDPTSKGIKRTEKEHET